MGKIFFAFSGYQNPGFDTRQTLAEGYELWDLTKMDFDGFLQEIKKVIPPLNANITDKDYTEGRIWKRDMPLLYADCRWGILMPIAGERSFEFGEESFFCINLYSPEFLYPMFVVNDFGIEAEPISHEKFISIRHVQQQWNVFANHFAEFHRLLLPSLSLLQWNADRVGTWTAEDFRVFNACILFNELKRYHNSKRPWFAGLEYTEQSVILETLFTLSKENTEISYRMKKRMAVLLQHVFPDIEADVQELYRRRSKYIHGATFEEIKKAGDDIGKIKVDFEFTAKCTKYIRFAIAVYLYMQKSGFAGQNGFKRIVDLLEAAIINTDLRNTIQKKADEVLSLMKP